MGTTEHTGNIGTPGGELDGLLNDGRPRDAHLSLRFNTRAHWPALRERITGLTDCGAAVAIALWSEAITGGRDVSYSRTAGHYEGRNSKAKDPLYTFLKVRGAVDHLDASGLLSGHFRQQAGVRTRQSTMRASDELVRLVGDALGPKPRLVPRSPRSPVVVRDASGAAMALRDTDALRRQIARVDRLNEGFRSVRLSHGAGACVTRIYHQSPDRGGRHYADGQSWQNMPKEARLSLTIDDERVVEWDYKGNHAQILYADAGVDMPSDAYEIGNWPRELTKVAFLILVNAKSRQEAIGAIANRDLIAMVGVDPGSPEARKTACYLLEAIEGRHDPIRRSFCTGAGGWLMKRDSEMAEDVMIRMRKRGIVVLPIYDAFLAPERHGSLLQETMIAVANDHGVPRMGVEKKA